ncbi:partial, partial [Paramuricea clavata]
TYKRQQTQGYNKRHRATCLSDLSPGETVWLPEMSSPAVVVSKSPEPRSYIVQTEKGTVRRNRRQVVPSPKEPVMRESQPTNESTSENISCPNIKTGDVTFATRFVAAYMFLKVKGSHPLTYQHLTLQMFESAKRNEGMVDQNIFKTAKRNSDLFSVLVFEAIRKYIYPTRYRQIIETESVHILLPNKQKWISEDQKHSSNVARVHNQKKRSREVAMRGCQCMQKLLDRSNSSQIEYEKQQQSSSEQEHVCQDIATTTTHKLANGVQVFALHLKKTIVYDWALEHLVYVGQQYITSSGI